MRKALLCLLLLATLAGCSTSGAPTGPNAGPVPGTTEGTTGGTTGGTVNNAGADPGGSLAAALDPARPPAVPANPPPAIAAREEQQRALEATYPLHDGWNVISFPFARVTATSGFRYQLYAYRQGSWVAVDPRVPSLIDTRLAYMAWSDGTSSVGVSGKDGEVSSILLSQGWNMIGCPSTALLPYGNMSATQVGATRRLSEAAGEWLSPTAYFLSSTGGLLSESLAVPGPGLPPFEARWIFCTTDLELNLNPVPPRPCPW